MKRSLMITSLLASMMVMVTVLIPAGNSTAEEPLRGAVEFGTQEDAELVWKSGRIERIDEEGMVVNDIGYRFTPDTKYYSTSGKDLSRMNFYPGTSVKFVLEKDLKTVASLIKQ